MIHWAEIASEVSSIVTLDAGVQGNNFGSECVLDLKEIRPFELYPYFYAIVYTILNASQV